MCSEEEAAATAPVGSLVSDSSWPSSSVKVTRTLMVLPSSSEIRVKVELLAPAITAPSAGAFVGVYWASPGPATVTSSRLERGLRSWVQIAPWVVQSVVTGSTMVTGPLPSGRTWISQPTLLFGASRRALITSPPVTVKAWSRMIL